MVYENYHSAKRKGSDEDVHESSHRPANFSNKRHATDPFAPYDDAVDDAPRFSPPVYIQRYVAVQNVLADPRYQGKIKKVVDFGCSELGFVTHLKNTVGIEEILCVDVDRETLENHKCKAIPLNADYLQNRSNPLTIHVYEGSVTQRDKKLANSDAVVAIELIEHLYPDTLMEFPYNVFGYIKPLVVAITTPNADFNVLFPSMGTEMRHWDHKFEWTRQQFEDWASNIVSRYPEYQVSFQGIGSGPTGKEHLGCCSQMAVFNRVRETESLPSYGIEGLFKSVSCQVYPYRVDNRSDEQKILDEAAYCIRQFTMNNPECLDEYPLKSLLKQLNKFYVSAETLREILENGGYAVVDHADGAAILCPALSTFSDYDDEITSEDVDDNWDVRENSHYGENFGTWGDGNAETVYDECWDDDYEIPATNLPVNNETQDHVESVNNIALEFELSLTRSLDTADFNGIEISNVSHVPSVPDSIEPDGLSSFLESFDSVEDNTREGVNISSNSPSIGNSLLKRNQNSSVESKHEAVTNNFESSSSLSQITSSAFAEAQRLDECSIEAEDTLELGSLCSMYLESSRNDERDVCPENITNPSFDCTALESSFEKSRNSVDAVPTASPSDRAASVLQIQARQSKSSALGRDFVTQPQFTSSPRASLERREGDALKSARCEDPVNRLKSVSQTSLQSDGNASTVTTTSSDSSFSTLRKLYPPEENSIYRNVDAVKLKGGNEMADEPIEEMTSESGELSSSESLEATNVQDDLHVTRLARQRAPESLELRSTTSSKDSKESLSILRTITQSTCSKKSWTEDAQQDAQQDPSVRAQMPSYVDSIPHTVDESHAASTHESNPGKIEEYSRLGLAETSEGVDAKPASPDATETPPNSWSPEIMDSGYPHSSSTQDMTPEYDLSSIAQDRISDSESPSIAEAPRLGFLDHADVENGDLANNNRDDEGNNMIAEAENDLEEDLQPLIDVLENDLENENDIYALENGFPAWLLRILVRGNAAGRQVVAEREDLVAGLGADVHAAGDAGMPDLDEGFDSTSSEDDNIEEVSTESSEETVHWNARGDYY